MNRIAFLAVVTPLFLGSATAAFSAPTLVTDPTGYSGPTLDLSAYANGSYNFTFGPLALPGGITFTGNPGGGGNSGLGSVVGQGGYGLTSNGSFGGNATYIGVDSGTGYDTLTFAAPISQFGGYWNYSPLSPGDAPTISAYDSSNNLLASFDLSVLAPIVTPGGFNQFEFRGIFDTVAEISSIRFGGQYLLLAGTADGSTPPTATPVPAALPLFVSGLAGLGWLARRKRKQSA